MIDGYYPKDGGAAPTVYVLIQPSGEPPCVFQTFDSRLMEAWLSLRARGSIVHFRASAFLEPSPSAAEWDAFKAFCQKHDITFVNESDMD